MEATVPQISLRQVPLWAWFLLALLIASVYSVGFDRGLITKALHSVPSMYLHEFFHDGRHLLGFPCH